MPPPAATQAAARLWTARVAPSNTNPPHLPRIPPKCRANGNCTVCSWLKLATKLAECMTPASWFRKTRFTRRRVRELKNAHNSVTVQNRTHVYMNFFHHKDLGNHLLQLWPKVVKHPVFKIFRISKDLSAVWITIPPSVCGILKQTVLNFINTLELRPRML